MLHDESMKKKGLHLKIGTLHFPPYIFVNQEHGSVYGIEPSLLQILAEKLNFTFEYAFAKPDEMWGDVKDFGGTNVTITGLTGMVYRGEIDLALGDLYINYDRKKYIDFTQPYGMGYECFMVPIPRPDPKWRALYDPFQLPVWIAILLSITFVALLLYFAAKRGKISAAFNNLYSTIFFLLTTLFGVQQNYEGITRSSTINRFLFGTWLLSVLVLSLSYQSVLTSFMTSPYTPPPVDTIQQLVDSSLGKIAYGDFFKNFLLISSIPLAKELGRQMTVTYNLTYMYSLMDSESWAIQSSKENLYYIVAKHFQEAGTENNRMHLMGECVWPMLSAFGLQRDSPLKQEFDYEMQRLFEAGLIQYHRSEFAKRPNDPTATATDAIKPLTLDDLQGAFYLLIAGLGASFICFVAERFIYHLKNVSKIIIL